MFSERLNALRLKRGMSQQAIASSVGMSLRHYQKIEHGETSPSIELAAKLADVLKVSLDYLMGRSNVDDSADTNGVPSVFISYSWTSPEYQERVVQLAEYLQTHGANVIFDKWDLTLGNDVNLFMEQSAKNSDFVLVLCDAAYKEKADARESGVGKETLIISPEVYRDAKQGKYIPIIMQRCEEGSTPIPTYMNDRLYVDYDHDEELGREQILRHIFKKPALQKPPIGKAPEFLMQDEKPFDIPPNADVLKAMSEGRPNVPMLVESYLEEIVDSLEQYRVLYDRNNDSSDDFAQKIVESIEQMQQVRDRMLDVITRFIRYPSQENENALILHRFFEKLYTYTDRKEEVSSYTTWDFDNYKFVVYELYLYILATYLKYEKFGALSSILTGYIALDKFSGYFLDAWTLLRMHLESLDRWKQSQATQWSSPAGHLIKERARRKDIQFLDLLQADAVLYIGARGDFYPWTGLYVSKSNALPLFARATSGQYAMKFLPTIGFDNPEAFKTTLSKIGLIFTGRSFPIDYRIACNAENFGSLP